MDKALPDLTSRQCEAFRKALLRWHRDHHRPLPWKGEKNPYLVWLSEIILQQTRVEQGLPYFERFKERFPTVQDLASASEDEVLKLWEGLGYYSRARNLHHSAKYIANELNGVFPDNYDDIRKLKGVGDYTAAAIASFAFDLPHAVVDGNVYRVLSRYFADGTPIDTAAGKRRFAALANMLIDPQRPADFNQAMMDLGAGLCTPSSPDCEACPLAAGCEARKNDQASSLPVKSKKLKRKTRHFVYLMIHHNDGFYIRQRTGKDIWKNLYELPLIELQKPLKNARQLKRLVPWLGPDLLPEIRITERCRHELTHQRIEAVFCELRVNDDFCAPEKECWQRVSLNDLPDFAFPKLILNYLQQKALSLERC
ncbi:MAG: A/G-specific adenine glycosylase [Saprospirales bacterium]|nr:A/G-specific adenine glycosylase [Saprospirales bacterium]